METNNIISVHQAFYGIVNQSHGCIHSTIKDSALNAFLTGFTDRPGPVPSGVKMEPYYAASAHGNYYIFTLTFPDYNANRSGMVFTHALIISIADLTLLNDLNELFSKFIIDIPAIKNKLDVLTLFPSVSSRLTNRFPAFIQLAVEKLLSGQSPVIFCGKADSFVQLINAIWTGVPASIRAKIVFTVGFSGANMDESKTFIHFQTNLKQQLNNKNFISDEFDQAVEITSVAEKYLLIEDPNNGLNQFIEDLKINLDDWNTLQITARAFEAYQNFSELNNDALKQLIRQVGKISPQPENGEIIKGKIIEELKKRLSNRLEQNLKSLKNIPLTPYNSGEKQLQDGIVSSLENEFKEETNFNIELVSELALIDTATDGNWWHKGVRKSFEKIKYFTETTQLENLWKIIIHSEELLSAVQIYLPVEKNYEDLLLATFPVNIPEKTAKILSAKVRLKKWFLLHAQLLQTYLSSKDAVWHQFSIERTDAAENFAGTETILSKISDTDLLDIALETKEDYFIKKYIDRTISDPLLLNSLTTDNSVWLQIWSGSIENTKSLAHGIINIPEKVKEIFTALSADIEIPSNLLQEISETEYADISSHKQRALIWSKLPVVCKEKILKSTADSILNNYKDIDADTIEQDLINHMLSEECIRAFLNRNNKNIDSVITMYEWFNATNDNLLSEFIRDFVGNISPVASDRLGQLILSKRFNHSAREVFEKAKQNDNFKIALAKCKSLASLGFWDRVKWGGILGETVTDNDVYAELTKIAIKLYDKGPEDNDIWKRSGGETSKLHNNRTREENWRNAIQLVRNDGGGKISAKSLVKEMLVDHSNNPELKQIIKYFK